MKRARSIRWYRNFSRTSLFRNLKIITKYVCISLDLWLRKNVDLRFLSFTLVTYNCAPVARLHKDVIFLPSKRNGIYTIILRSFLTFSMFNVIAPAKKSKQPEKFFSSSRRKRKEAMLLVAERKSCFHKFYTVTRVTLRDIFFSFFSFFSNFDPAINLYFLNSARHSPVSVGFDMKFNPYDDKSRGETSACRDGGNFTRTRTVKGNEIFSLAFISRVAI